MEGTDHYGALCEREGIPAVSQHPQVQGESACVLDFRPQWFICSTPVMNE